MFCSKKKFLAGVTKFVDGSGEDRNLWRFGADVKVPGFNTAFQIWQAWRLGGQWLLGDWFQQPLSLLVKIDAIDTVYWAWKEYRYTDKQEKPKRGLVALSATQKEIVRYLDND